MRRIDFLYDLRNFINKHTNIESYVKVIKYKKGGEIEEYLDGEEYLIITLENGEEIRVNITGSTNIKIIRDVLFKLD